jgi:hypothetical protein
MDAELARHLEEDERCCSRAEFIDPRCLIVKERSYDKIRALKL